MKRKLKIIARVAKKALKKTTHLTHKNFYKGYSVPEAAYRAATYPMRHGVRATLSIAKREMLRIGGQSSVKHIFPNGLVSGVDKAHIKPWYDNHARKVSIVIPSYNDYELLKVCVESVHRTIMHKDTYEIIIVDDFCQPESRNYLKEFEADNVRVIYREKNGGFAAAVNTGLRVVPKTHDALLLNSDIEAHPGWFEAIQYGAYVFGEKVGIVAPKLLYPDGRIQSAGSYRNTEAREWFDHYYRFQEADYGPANVPTYVQAATGACLYIKRSLIDEVGILDEDLPFAFEEVDLCLRTWQADKRVLYFPASVLTHHESPTRSKNKNISSMERTSVVNFWKKWGDWYDKRNVRNEKGQVRIIYVLQTLGWSGGIRIAVEHANRLAQRGFAIEIWSLDNKPVWPIDVPTRSFKNYRQLTAALEHEEAIKVATWWETAYPVWFASLKKGIAVNFIQEIETWFYPDDYDAQRVVVSSYRKEFRNLTTSSFNYDEIRSFGLDAALVPCAYDDTIYKVLSQAKRKNDVLLALGRTFFQKNFMFSFRSWQRLGEKRPNFWLFGSEPDLKSLDKKITYFTKPSDERVNELYNEATAFVQTSYHEGFCLPILEAMAAGLPVVCTDAHGNRDFCHDGKNCLLVEQDNEEALAAAIQRLFNDPKLREKLSREALKTVKNYQWEPVIDRLVGFYDDVATPKPVDEYVEKKYGLKKK